MADANSAPYASVKNRSRRVPNKRPYDTFAEGTASAEPPSKIVNKASPSTEQVNPALVNQQPANPPLANPPSEQNLLINLQRVENERRDLLRGMIGKLNRASLEELLVDAGLDHKTVMTNVIAASAKPDNLRKDGYGGVNGTSEGQLQLPERPSLGFEAPKSFASRPNVSSFIAQYRPHDLTPPTEPKPYTTPYPPLPQSAPPAPVNTPPVAPPSLPKSRKKVKTDRAAPSSEPKPRGRARAQSLASPVTKPKAKPTRPYSTKKFPGRGPGRWPRGTTKADMAAAAASPKKTASGRVVKSKKYTEPDTEDEEEEEEEEALVDDDDTEIDEDLEEELATPSTSTPGTGTVAVKKTRKPKNPADKNKEQTMIPVGILAGNSNVALAGFDRRMGLIFRTSRYNRDGEFIGLGEGNSRSIKRDKVDFHPVLASLNEEELRKEILRRQQKIGYNPPPGRDISGAPSGRRATLG